MSAVQLPKKLQDRITKLRGDGLSKSAVARELRLDRDTVRKYWGAEGAPSKFDPVAAARRKAQEREQSAAIAEAVKEQAFRDVLRELVTSQAPAVEPPPRYKPPKPPKDAAVETLVLHLSDWHANEIVRAENTFGLNEVNREVTLRRVAKIVRSVLNIKARLELGGYRFPRLVIACNGDMVPGTIHEAERHTDGANAVRTALDVGQLLATAIRDLSGGFEQVYAFGTSGNHGRLPDARKVQFKEPSRSWDYLVYQYAAAMLRDCGNVQFEIPDAWAVMYEVEGKLFYQGHGHFIKSWNSIPFYGITRMTSKLGAVLATHFRPVDYWLFGHFHVTRQHRERGRRVPHQPGARRAAGAGHPRVRRRDAAGATACSA
jgi:hypothetical protein